MYIFFLNMLKNFFFEFIELFFKKMYFFEKTYIYIHISTLLYNYAQKKMAHLSWPPPNLKLIGGLCDSLRKY